MPLCENYVRDFLIAAIGKRDEWHFFIFLFFDDMEDDFALRYVRIYPGVNSRAELVTLA